MKQLTLQDQCCSAEQGARLRELGVAAPSLFTWHGDIDPDNYYVYIGCVDAITAKAIGPAYTVAELGEILPRNYSSGRTAKQWAEYSLDKEWWCGESLREEGQVFAPTEAQARAAMLIHLIESGLFDPKSL